MKITDPRLYQARSLDDLLFRLRWSETDNVMRRLAVREMASLMVGFVAPDLERVVGIDISDWDGNVDLAVSKAKGIDFVIIKAIDGTIRSKYWEANHQRAMQAGLAAGPYGWLYPDRYVSCAAQARAYWELIKNTLIRIPPVIDFEWTRFAGQQADPNYTDLDKWVTEFNRLSPGKSILYSAAGYMNKFGRMPDALRRKFAGFWFASYGGVTPLYPMGFSSHDVWQFTASGDALLFAPGDRQKKELDLNYATKEFADRYALEVTQPGNGGTMTTKFYRLNTTAVNIRSGPGASYSDLGDLIRDDVVQVEETLGGWSRFVRAQHRDGTSVQLVNGTQVHLYSGPCWATNAYFVQVAGLPNPPVVTDPEPVPDPQEPPDYITAHWVASGVTKKYLPE